MYKIRDMPLFRYKAVASDGQILHGEIDAPSRAVAISRLQNSGHLPISADEIDSERNLIQNILSKFRQRHAVNHKDIILFTRELATLLQAGLPLDTALKMLESTSSSSNIKTLINSINEKIQGGVSLSEAMAAHNDIFSRLYLNMVKAGEAGGSLQTIIDRMASYLEHMWELRSSVITALIYPAILLVITGLSLLVLLTFVVPQFAPLFDDAGETLPLMTQFVFGMAGLFKSYWWLLIIVFVGGLWFADKQLADPARRLRFDAWTLGLPYIGETLTQLEIARFARTLGTLLMNGVPVMTAVSLVRDVLNNRQIAGLMDDVVASLEQGQRLARPLKESRFFPPLAVQLIEVGEESGQLESMLIKIADIYDKEVQASIKRLLTLLEPVIILSLGGVIAFIILSILLALVGLNELIG